MADARAAPRAVVFGYDERLRLGGRFAIGLGRASVLGGRRERGWAFVQAFGRGASGRARETPRIAGVSGSPLLAPAGLMEFSEVARDLSLLLRTRPFLDLDLPASRLIHRAERF
jgi:hypothetical protein